MRLESIHILDGTCSISKNGPHILFLKTASHCLQLLTGRNPARNCLSFQEGGRGEDHHQLKFPRNSEEKIKLHFNYIMSCASLTYQLHIYQHICWVSSAVMDNWTQWWVCPAMGLLPAKSSQGHGLGCGLPKQTDWHQRRKNMLWGNSHLDLNFNCPTYQLEKTP